MTNFENPGFHNSERKANKVEIESIEDAVLEYVIGESRAINSGNNGIIFLIKINDYPELKKIFGPESEDKVFKLLKVYRPGEGQHEFEIQNEAYELIENSPNKDELAKIPKPLLFRDIDLHEQTLEKLKQMGAEISGQAEVLLMDLVDGKDLATIFDEWILKNSNPDNLQPRNQGFDELHATVSQVLKFETPGKKSIREGDRIYEERKVQMRNADKIYSTLKRSGFKFDQKITNKIQKTLKLLHDGGVYHNDPHERNFMISESGDPYIVDFGAAGHKPSDERVSDEYIVNRLKELSVAEKNDNSEYDVLLNRLSKDTLWNETFKKIVENLPLSIFEIELALSQTVSNELKFSKNLALLHGLLKNNFIEKEKISAMLKNFLNKKNIPTWVYNKVKKFIEAI